MAMADLSLHAVQWCTQHGHPVLALRTSDDRFFIVSISADDASALSLLPEPNDGGRAPHRLHHLVEATVAALGAHLTEVRLLVGRDDVLRASLQLEGPCGSLALPAYFADGVALAFRGKLPLRMADEDLRRVPLTPLASDEPAHVPTRESAPPPPPDAFRALIDSLDLDSLGRRPGDDDGTGDHRVA